MFPSVPSRSEIKVRIIAPTVPFESKCIQTKYFDLYGSREYDMIVAVDIRIPSWPQSPRKIGSHFMSIASLNTSGPTLKHYHESEIDGLIVLLY